MRWITPCQFSYRICLQIGAVFAGITRTCKNKMKPADQWKIAVFLCALVCVAILVGTRRRAASSRDLINRLNAAKPGVPVAQTPAAPLTIPTPPPVQQPVAPPPPVVSRPVIWPGDVPPTQVIRIPDPAKPTTGTMDLVLHSGDELEFDFEPQWVCNLEEVSPAIEIAVDDGSGFKPLAEYQQGRLNRAGTNTWWMKRRVGRYHLRAGAAQEARMRMVINRNSEEASRPDRPLEPQRFGDLAVNVRRLEWSGGNSHTEVAKLDLEFRNTSQEHAIGVAFHRVTPYVSDSAVKTSLVASDKEYSFDEASGMRTMYADAGDLTEIGPGETRMVSLSLRTPWGFWGKVSQAVLRSEIVLDSSFRSASPANYARSSQELPPNCRLENIYFEIPLHPH